MPIYEYKCDLCNGLWEEIQKFSDDPLTVCKSCEKEGGVHKLIPGSMNFILRGEGWYKDGYSSKKDEPKAETVMNKINTINIMIISGSSNNRSLIFSMVFIFLSFFYVIIN